MPMGKPYQTEVGAEWINIMRDSVLKARAGDPRMLALLRKYLSDPKLARCSSVFVAAGISKTEISKLTFVDNTALCDAMAEHIVVMENAGPMHLLAALVKNDLGVFASRTSDNVEKLVLLSA